MDKTLKLKNEALKKKLFELGIATPYLVADALASAFEISVNNIPLVRESRLKIENPEETDTDDFIDTEIIDVEIL